MKPLTSDEIVERARLKQFLYRRRLKHMGVACLILAAVLLFVLLMKP